MIRLLFLTPLLLVGCTMEQVEAVAKTVGDVAVAAGTPHGALITFGITAGLAGYKWWKNSRDVKGLVRAVQDLKEGMSVGERVVVNSKLNDIMPEKLKAVVKKIKSKF